MMTLHLQPDNTKLQYECKMSDSDWWLHARKDFHTFNKATGWKLVFSPQSNGSVKPSIDPILTTVGLPNNSPVTPFLLNISKSYISWFKDFKEYKLFWVIVELLLPDLTYDTWKLIHIFVHIYSYIYIYLFT